MTEQSPEEQSRLLATDSLAGGDPTGWFERLYVAAEQGTAVVPWDRDTPNLFLVHWAVGGDGPGRRALVVGAGLGRDAEYIASLGFETVAFDVSPTSRVPAAVIRTRPYGMRWLTCSTRRPTGARGSTSWSRA
jgi:hypothetical protein